MVWFVFRGSTSFENQIRRDSGLKSLDEIFELLLNQRVNTPRFVSKPERLCRQCGKSYTEDLYARDLCEKCLSKNTGQRIRPSTYPCNNCGIRFSVNLLKNGLCNGCRKCGQSTTEHESPGNRRVEPSISDKAVSEAYQTLGCDESDADEIIKRRRRELAKEFHADHMSQGTLPDHIRDANERFCLAQEAYEIIMISRKKGT